jgi:PAS domain S-box-containing protein
MTVLDMIRQSPLAAVLTNAREPDNPIVACNTAFVGLTGYAEAEIIGRNCRFLSGGATDPDARARLRAAIRTCQPAIVELLNYRKDGTPFRNALMIAPIFGADGGVDYFLGSQVDVTAPGRLAPTAAADRIAALSARQRQVLLAIAKGLSSKQIAHGLGLTERTIKMHRAALLRRLGARSAVEAIRIAIEAGY